MTYKQLCQKEMEPVEKYIRIIEPISFIGMYDASQHFMFNQLAQNLPDYQSNTVQLLIFSLNQNDQVKENRYITSVLNKNLNLYLSDDSSSTDWLSSINKVLQKRKLVFIFHLSDTYEMSLNVAYFLDTLRDQFTFNFSYMLFGYTNIYNISTVKDPHVEKILMRNICSIPPKDFDESSAISGLYLDRFSKKISKDDKQLIFDLSGGNPGLIKALSIAYSEEKINWASPSENLDLRFRINKICSRLKKVV